MVATKNKHTACFSCELSTLYVEETTFEPGIKS